MTRLAELYRLRAKVDAEILAEENSIIRQQRLTSEIAVPEDEEPDVPLHVCRQPGNALGGPQVLEDTHTEDGAREAHRAFRHGDRSEWVREGERQYQRQCARNTRARRRKQAS